MKSGNVSSSWTRWRRHLKRKMNDVSRGISEHFMFTVPLIKMPNFSTGYCDGPANTVDLKYSGSCDRCSLIRRNLWDINMVSRAEFLFELMTLRGVITPKLFPARPENCSKDTSKAKREGRHDEKIFQENNYGIFFHFLTKTYWVSNENVVCLRQANNKFQQLFCASNLNPAVFNQITSCASVSKFSKINQDLSLVVRAKKSVLICCRSTGTDNFPPPSVW